MGALAKEVRYKKPLYQKKVEAVLKRYRIVKKLMDTGLYDLCSFPPLTPSYGERVGKGYSQYDSTQKYGIQRAEDTLLVKAVETALAVLSEDERRIIQERYLSDYQPTDIMVINILKMSERNYYRIKRSAMKTLAFALAGFWQDFGRN